MSENEIWFKLACSLPIFNHHIISKVGYFGETTEVQELIHNSIAIKTNNPFLNAFFQLFYNPTVSPISWEISTKQWIQHWKSSREKTASSFSGIHFGHYKVQSINYFLSKFFSTLDVDFSWDYLFSLFFTTLVFLPEPLPTY